MGARPDEGQDDEDKAATEKGSRFTCTFSRLTRRQFQTTTRRALLFHVYVPLNGRYNPALGLTSLL